MNMLSDGRRMLEFYPEWREEANCATTENVQKYYKEHDVWFPDEDQTEEQKRADTKLALFICSSCPVRDLCLQDTLETQTISGNRGGNSEEDIRLALSVDEFGKEVRRGEYTDCPYCHAETELLKPTTVDLPEGGRWSVAKAVECTVCHFKWKSRSAYNSVEAHHKEQTRKAEQARKEQIARERLSK